ncbi:MAG: hypothetical protein UY31_C0047G0007, partial [Candidatus Wolfebacteria bacterium GW2011_GWE1_48_7]
MNNIRTTTGIIVATPLLFWGGWNIGKAVYPESMTMPITPPTHIRSEIPEVTKSDVCAETLKLLDETDRHYCFEAPKLT